MLSNSLRRSFSLLTLATLTTMPVAATCGGGGGGGMGGVQGSAAGKPTTYQVPWSLLRAGEKPAATARLVLYWFPASPTEARSSDLQSSRVLALATARCVATEIVPPDNSELYGRYLTSAKPPVALLATADGKEVGRAPAPGQTLTARLVEKVLDDEMKRRESAAKEQLDSAEKKATAGDKDAAATLYQVIWADRCLLPDSGKKAAKGLKAIGRPVPDKEAMGLGPLPATDAGTNSRLVSLMDRGLAAEEASDYRKAAALYTQAHTADRADAVPLRYLGELERHHLGDWVAARRIFNEVLAMPADPVSRAVALHGLGKMTIHEGDNKGGLALIEESVSTYPLALAYRNLAVFWNTEGQVAKAQGFAEQALALDPEDTYTQIFAAAFIAEDGRKDEALRIAHQHEDLLAASYNLAAIQSLLGHRTEALALLKRHFYTYERYDSVRSKEMKEAREDIVFDFIKNDPEFVALTAKAEKPHAASTMGQARR
jgi:tetratricopeptide (TPR) repeat protein